MEHGPLLKNVIYRAAILIVVKILGFIARLPLFRLLGPEGVGLYQMAYAIYGLALTVIIGGLPSSLSLAAAKNHDHGTRLFRKLSPYMVLLGAGTAVFGYLYADWIADRMGNDQLTIAIRCLAPAMMIVPAISLYRGYLQGLDQQLPIAFSELAEQLIRVTVMVISVYLLLPFGLHYQVGGAVLGAFGGALGAAGFFFLLSRRMEYIGSAFPQSHFHSIPLGTRVFLLSSLSLAATRFIIPLSEFLDAYLIPQRLQHAGYTGSQAVSIYGELAGMGALVVYMPTLITNVLGYTLSPRLTSDWASGHMERFSRRAQQALRIGFLWGAGAGGFLYLFAEPLSKLFFSDASAVQAIRCMSLVPLASGIRELTMLTLWASGKKKAPLYGLLIGIVLSALCNFWLIVIPGFGYYGAVIGILSVEVVTSLWNLYELHRSRRLRIPWGPTVRSISFLLSGILGIHLAGRFLFGYQAGHDLMMDVIQMGLVLSGMFYMYALAFLKK